MVKPFAIAAKAVEAWLTDAGALSGLYKSPTHTSR